MRQQWEYWTRYESAPLDVTDLNDEGQKGWELVSVTFAPSRQELNSNFGLDIQGTFTGRYYYVFKRIVVGLQF